MEAVRREKKHNVRSIFVTAIPFAEDVPSEELTNSEEKFACFGFGTLEPSLERAHRFGQVEWVSRVS